MEQKVHAFKSCKLGLGMYIFVQICDLHSWYMVLENRMWSLKSSWKSIKNTCIFLYESCWLNVLTRALLSNSFKKNLLNLLWKIYVTTISAFKTEMIVLFLRVT